MLQQAGEPAAAGRRGWKGMSMKKAANSPVRLSSLFGPHDILCRSGSLDGKQVVRELIERIAQNGEPIDIEPAYQSVISGECCAFTRLNHYMLIVHARLPGIRRLRIALAIHPAGVECTCEQNQTALIKLLVLVLTPLDEPAGFMRAMTALTQLCQTPGFLNRVCRLQQPSEVWEYINDLDEYLPDHVRAGDIMRTDFRTLRNTDTLSEAIDAFCQLDVTELPVVDDDGDLVGVVSETELIRMCLPEYITWMEDLSPIIDFQPFAEILRRENDMPVVEIMVLAENYAVVSETAPAVHVAKVMMRRDVQQVLVLRDHQLVGLISIQDFIRKVLRA